MPLTLYLKGSHFDQTAIDAMTAAFKACCWFLQVEDGDSPLREIVARKVIEVASTGGRDPERIRDVVLLALNDEKRTTLYQLHNGLNRGF
jgi:hypothetical protein